MTKWIVVIALILSVSILGFVYVQLNNVGSDAASTTSVEAPNTIHILHSYKDGVHRFAGQIKLPHSCYRVASDAVIPPDEPRNITITLNTTDNLLSEKICSSIPTRYPFEVIADAPQDAVATLTIDGVTQPIKITETNWQDSQGTQYNTLINEMPK